MIDFIKKAEKDMSNKNKEKMSIIQKPIIKWIRKSKLTITRIVKIEWKAEKDVICFTTRNWNSQAGRANSN
jgi:hypothetical protein